MTDSEYYIKKYEIMEWSKCNSSPQYFIENYNYITSPINGQHRMKLYPWQDQVIKVYQNYDRIIGNVSRQAGTTTTTLAYIFWYSLFGYNRKIIIASSTVSIGDDIMNSLMVSYHLLPEFLKQKVEYRTKSKLEFGNRCTIHIVPFSTLQNSTRGSSISLLWIDNAAFLKSNQLNEYLNYIAPPALQPDGKIILTSSPSGRDHHFYNIWHGAQTNKNGYFPYQTLWAEVPGRGSDFEKKMRVHLGDESWYNEYNCSFI